jgi:hypothetical protein
MQDLVLKSVLTDYAPNAALVNLKVTSWTLFLKYQITQEAGACTWPLLLLRDGPVENSSGSRDAGHCRLVDLQRSHAAKSLSLIIVQFKNV